MLKSNIFRIFSFSFILFYSFQVNAQAPDGINYQAVIRNLSGSLIANSTIALRIQVKQTSASGTIVFQERHSVTTSAQGLVNLVIGQGTLLGGNFSTINWTAGPYFVSLGVNFSNGTTYLDYGSQQLMSVPYALYAKNAGNQLNQWRYGNVLPANNLGVLGDFYLDMIIGNVYYKSSATTWILTGNIKGPTGATGVAGPAGAQGLIGLTGPAGPAGPTGATGVAGPAGAQGLIGLTGPAGPAGPTGATGVAGPAGAQGLIGLTGPSGPAGPTGATGVAGPAGAQGIAGPQGIQGLTGPAGPTGATGPSGGPAGPTGPQGPTGLTGPAGTNGTAVLNGTSAPSINTGVDGDFYINTASNELYGPKANGVWTTSVLLIGPAGPSGIAGATGSVGPIGLTGPAGPTGNAGLPGATGPIGLTGPAGTNGTAVLNGTSVPSLSTGVDGDFYINTASNELFGPKANGVWSNGVSLVGPAGVSGTPGNPGPQGPQGVQGPAGGGMTVNCGTTFNTNYTIRGDGSGTYECTNALVVTSTGKVGIGNTSPSSSYDLNVGNGGILVDGTTTTSNFAGKLRVGGTTSTSYDFQVDGQAYVTSGLRIGTTSTPVTGGILTSGNIETNGRFVQNSSTTGTGTVLVRTSAGELRPQSSTKFVKDNIRDLQYDKKKVFALRPVIYNLKPALGGDQEIGLIAEEVAEVMPELVILGPERQWVGNTGIPQTDANGVEINDPSKMVPYSVYYDRLPVYLLSIIKEQEERINALEKRLNALEKE
jgi:hypothetical protein